MVWVYDGRSTKAGGVKRVVKEQKEGIGLKTIRVGIQTTTVANCWTGPYQNLCVGPGITSKGQEVGLKLILLDVKKDEPGRQVNAKVLVHRCKKC